MVQDTGIVNKLPCGEVEDSGESPPGLLKALETFKLSWMMYLFSVACSARTVSLDRQIEEVLWTSPVLQLICTRAGYSCDTLS